MKDLSYKGHILAINELPNFGSTDKLYRAISIYGDKKWIRDADTIEYLISLFKSHVDYLDNGKVYEQIRQEWGSAYKRIDYKGRWLSITARKRAKDNRVVYLGEFCSKDYKRSKSIESIHYDKVISKFEKFVDEYCTDWLGFGSCEYNGYTLKSKYSPDGKEFFGTCEIHKNSTFKCISNSLKEIEDKFKTRIDQLIRGKEKNMNPLSTKEERIKELESVIARLQKELEEVKKEKEIYVYKGVSLEYSNEGKLPNTYVVGKIKNHKYNKTFKVSHNKALIENFEDYIDDLQKSAQLYCELTNKIMIFNG